MSREWIKRITDDESLKLGDKVGIRGKEYILGEPILFRGIPTTMIKLNEKERSVTLYSENYGSFQMSNIGANIGNFWDYINDMFEIP